MSLRTADALERSGNAGVDVALWVDGVGSCVLGSGVGRFSCYGWVWLERSGGNACCTKQAPLYCYQMVHLITGLPGSGKTEIARRLRSLLNAIVVNTDALLHAIQPPQAFTASPVFRADQLDLVYSIIPSVVRQLGAQAPAQHIILDGTFRFARHRQAALDAAASVGHQSCVIRVTAPDGLIRERLRVRNAAGLQRVDSSTLAVAMEQYETPNGAYNMPNETNQEAALDSAVKAYVDGLKEAATTGSRDWITAMWSLQDNLLQWYRAIFIAGQTLLFVVAIAFLQIGQSWVHSGIAFLLALAGLLSLKPWLKIARHRGLNVHYWQLRLLKIEDGNPGPPIGFTKFMDWEKLDLLRRERDISEDPVWKAHHRVDKDITRHFFQSALPAFLSVVWCLFVLVTLYPLLPQIMAFLPQIRAFLLF